MSNAITTNSNSTHDLCLFHAVQKLKGLSFFSTNREEKLNDIQENLECALEKYGKKMEKNIKEDKLSLLERTIKTLYFYSSFFTNTSSQIEQTTYAPKVFRL